MPDMGIALIPDEIKNIENNVNELALLECFMNEPTSIDNYHSKYTKILYLEESEACKLTNEFNLKNIKFEIHSKKNHTIKIVEDNFSLEK